MGLPVQARRSVRAQTVGAAQSDRPRAGRVRRRAGGGGAGGSGRPRPGAIGLGCVPNGRVGYL